jgi:hypothetical protein
MFVFVDPTTLRWKVQLCTFKSTRVVTFYKLYIFYSFIPASNYTIQFPEVTFKVHRSLTAFGIYRTALVCCVRVQVQQKESGVKNS